MRAEIHASKVTYCSFTDPHFRRFDAIVVGSVDQITEEVITKAITKRQSTLNKAAALAESIEEVPTVTQADLIFRVMTSEHIPIDPNPDRKRRNRTGDVDRMRTNFPPFKHFVMRDGGYVEVGRSHWRGDFTTGQFCADGGITTKKLALMYKMLVDQYSRRANWRNYTWLDDMRGQALLQLTQVGLQFDESKSDNPFAFYTTVLTNCFKRVVNVERKNQSIRDDLLIMAGASPSFRRQIDNEMSYWEQRTEQVKVVEGAVGSVARSDTTVMKAREELEE